MDITQGFQCECGFATKARRMSKAHLQSTRHYLGMRGGTDQTYKEIMVMKYYIHNKMKVRDNNGKGSRNWQVINDNELKPLLEQYRKKADPFLSGLPWHEDYVRQTLANMELIKK